MTSYDDRIWRRTEILMWISVGIYLLLLTSPVWAQGNDDHGHGQAHHGNDSDLIAGAPITVGGGDSIGIGGADYDIGRGSCKYHVGGLTLAWARTDEFCEGIDMIRLGMVDAGILHICEQTHVIQNYESLKACKEGLVIQMNTPPDNSGPSGLNRSNPDNEDEDERYVQHEEEVKSLRGALDAVVERLEQERAQTVQQQQIQQQRYDQVRQEQVARDTREEDAKAFFRKKYEASIAKEIPDEGT